jgi:hypothetical protein
MLLSQRQYAASGFQRIFRIDFHRQGEEISDHAFRLLLANAFASDRHQESIRDFRGPMGWHSSPITILEPAKKGVRLGTGLVLETPGQGEGCVWNEDGDSDLVAFVN